MPEAPAERVHKSSLWQVAGWVSFSRTPRCLGGRAVFSSWSSHVRLSLLPSVGFAHFQLKRLAVWNSGKTSSVFNFPAKHGTKIRWGFAGPCFSVKGSRIQRVSLVLNVTVLDGVGTGTYNFRDYSYRGYLYFSAVLSQFKSSLSPSIILTV